MIVSPGPHSIAADYISFSPLPEHITSFGHLYPVITSSIVPYSRIPDIHIPSDFDDDRRRHGGHHHHHHQRQHHPTACPGHSRTTPYLPPRPVVPPSYHLPVTPQPPPRHHQRHPSPLPHPHPSIFTPFFTLPHSFCCSTRLMYPYSFPLEPPSDYSSPSDASSHLESFIFSSDSLSPLRFLIPFPSPLPPANLLLIPYSPHNLST
ncbi:hypothetical protein AB6A40_003195 [Gnathostoma spinigerum]|uniref:Uncharacterized protein n=1 Tax=Gnathostoma spinigerum TaxID=75299 RepID=A0ABD6EBB3_9BILA